MLRKIRHPLSLCIAAISLFYIITSWAENEDSLYTAYVPVESQSIQDRQAALPIALNQVLIKVSGNPQIGSLAAVQTQLPFAAEILDSYRYQTPAKDSNAADVANQLELVAEFDAKQVDNLLQITKQPVWPRKRPETIVWLISVGDLGKQFVNGNDTVQIMEVLQSTARERGISLLFPLYDLTDLGQVTIDDIWTPDIKVVQAASTRYASDGILIGKILPHPDSTPDVPRWQGQWIFLLDGSKLTWQNTGSDEKQVAEHSINELADLMAKRYAKTTQTEGKIEYVTIEVSGITTMDSFTKVNLYLSKLNVVNKLSVPAINNTTIVFDLGVVGGKHALIEALGTEKILVPSSSSYHKLPQSEYLQYRVAS